MSLGWLRCIPLQLVLAAGDVEMSVAQMLKLQLSFMKVYVAVSAGADDHILLPCLDIAKELYSLISKCLKIFLLQSIHLRRQVVAEGCTCCCLLLLPKE